MVKLMNCIKIRNFKYFVLGVTVDNFRFIAFLFLEICFDLKWPKMALSLYPQNCVVQSFSASKLSSQGVLLTCQGDLLSSQ